MFISYSRRDGDFVRELHTFLTGCGKDVWVDWEDIPPASQWAQDIDDSIDSADSFVFVISGSSLASQYALDELRHAGERGKRIVPIACDGADPDRAPEGLRQLNWIWCRPGDDRPEAFAKVLDALETDLAWAEAHTRLLVRAVEWETGRDSSLLMRGRDLEDAEQQLAANAGKEPVVTELQREYLLASRRASARRQRIILGSVSLALLVSVSLGIVALLQRNEANERAEIARSQALAAQATAALDSDPVAALANAVSAMEIHRTPEAGLALRRAILANPVAYAIGADGEPRGGGASVDALAFSDDGRSLLGLTPDDVLHVWRSQTGRAAAAATGTTMFAQQGRLLLAARSSEARVVDLRTGAVRDTLRVTDGRVIGVGFSRGAPRAAVAAGDTVVLRRVPAGPTVALAVRAGRRTRVLFAASGERVVSFGSDTRARVWDARTGRQLATLMAAKTAAISPDGRFVATIDAVGAATLWSVGRPGKRARLGHAAGVVFSPDSQLALALAQDGGAGVWRAATGNLVATFPGFGSLGAGAVTFTTKFSPGAAFSRDSSLVALANADGNVRIWDVPARKQLGAVATGWANALAFATNGQMLAAMTWDGDVVVAPSPPGIPLRTDFRPNSCVPDFDPVMAADGRHVLARAAGGAGVWTVDGRRVATLAPPARPAALGARVGSAVFSGDGTAVAAASSPNGCIRFPGERHATAVWRLGRRAPLRGLGAYGSLMVDAHGRLVAVGGDVWPTTGGDPLPGLGEVLAISPSGERALALRAGGLEVVETDSGRTAAALHDTGPLVAEVRDLGSVEASFSPDGTRLLTSWNLNARLWDATTGEPIAFVGRNGEEIGQFAFGDSGHLVLATSPRRAAVLSAADGALLSSVTGPFDGGAVSSDGTLAAAPQADGAVDVVDITTGTRTTLQTDTGVGLSSASFGPTADVIVARDVRGDVHVVSCEICAPEDELVALARSRLATVSRIEPKPPRVLGVA